MNLSFINIVILMEEQFYFNMFKSRSSKRNYWNELINDELFDVKMEEKFNEFYRYSNRKILSIWKECIFVFDTNILLNLYRYQKRTSDKYLEILENIREENRIWIPHQVGLEFHKNRHKTIVHMMESYDKMAQKIRSSLNAAKQAGESYGFEHPFIDIKKINQQIDIYCNEICDTILKIKDTHPNWIDDDSILKSLSNIFQGFVGEPYSTEKINKIREEAKKRELEKLPPGYMDSKKKKGDCCGDMILWKQILDMAKKNKKPVIFVTDDKKEDWWLKISGINFGPRFELRKEIMDFAGVDFHMYSSKNFLEHAHNYYGQIADQEILKEVQSMSSNWFDKSLSTILSMEDISVNNLKNFIFNYKKLSQKILTIAESEIPDTFLFFQIKEGHEIMMGILKHLAEDSSNKIALIEMAFGQRDVIKDEIESHLNNEKYNKKTLKKMIFYLGIMKEVFDNLLRKNSTIWNEEFMDFFYS